MSERKVGTLSTTPGIAAASMRRARASTKRAQVRVDAVAELDHQRGVAGGQELRSCGAVFGGGQCGNPARLSGSFDIVWSCP